jgi:hypothetical protein
MKTYVEFKPDLEKGGEPIPGALRIRSSGSF